MIYKSYSKPLKKYFYGFEFQTISRVKSVSELLVRRRRIDIKTSPYFWTVFGHPPTFSELLDFVGCNLKLDYAKA